MMMQINLTKKGDGEYNVELAMDSKTNEMTLTEVKMLIDELSRRIQTKLDSEETKGGW